MLQGKVLGLQMNDTLKLARGLAGALLEKQRSPAEAVAGGERGGRGCEALRGYNGPKFAKVTFFFILV